MRTEAEEGSIQNEKYAKISVRAAGDITYADALRLRPGSAEEKRRRCTAGTGRSRSWTGKHRLCTQHRFHKRGGRRRLCLCTAAACGIPGARCSARRRRSRLYFTAGLLQQLQQLLKISRAL